MPLPTKRKTKPAYPPIDGVPSCRACGKHPWFTPCRAGEHRPSAILKRLAKRRPDLLEAA